MSEVRGLRLSASAALKEKRLAALLGEREPADTLVAEAVEDAQILGSLELSGHRFTWEEVKASRRGEPAPASIAWLREARGAVHPSAPFSVAALLAWHAAASRSGAGLRTADWFQEVDRLRLGLGLGEDGPPPAPGALVASRVAILEQWLNVESAREMKPQQQGALVLARIAEILPFDHANGRVARLAASHLMVRAGARPPILVGADAPRIREALAAAFQLATEPLCALLEEASERSLDVMIQTLRARGA